MTTAFQQTLVALRSEDVAFILSRLRSEEIPMQEIPAVSNTRNRTPDTLAGTDAHHEKSDDDEEGRRRRHIEREWPAVGTILTAEYYGERYSAEIISAAKRLKSGKQIRIASGPSRNAICDSFSEAMLSATEMQRASQNLGRKGVSNGWRFWDWPGKPADIAGDDDEE